MYDETQFISKLFAETVDLWAKKDKNAIKIRKNTLFVWWFHKNVLPLHSQNERCHSSVGRAKD